MKLRVLVADDNNAVRSMICKQLREWGYAASEAAGGIQALEMLVQTAGTEERPNILLVDWHMPELDGISLCRWAKTNQAYRTGPNLYVLFLTVSEGTDYETTAFKAGADGYVVKGSWEELEAKLNSIKARIREEDGLRSTIAALQKDPSGVLVKKEIMARLARRSTDGDRVPMGIVMMDIDDFKRINDTHGHLVGDQILEAVGRRLRESVRNGNVGRYGGDEFLIGLPGCDWATTEKRAGEIAARLTADPVSTSAGEIALSISYGAAANEESVALESLIEKADRALYRQKQEKRETRITDDAARKTRGE